VQDVSLYPQFFKLSFQRILAILIEMELKKLGTRFSFLKGDFEKLIL